MGGRAFDSLLPEASFPRMPPAVYNELKDRLTRQLRELYAVVAVPHEAPGKVDHGDIDFVVYGPREGLTLDEVQDTLGARHSILLDGNRMSNFAVPANILDGDASDCIYHQIDINVCKSKEELAGIVSFNSYGDLGMILGLLAAASQLAFGSSGLKLQKPVQTSPPCTFYLTTSFPRILAFFGLDYEKWEEGFTSQDEIFSWVSSSPLFVVWLATLSPSQSGYPSRFATRTMYQNFLSFSRAQRSTLDSWPKPRDIRDALVHFNKAELHDALLHVTRVKRHVKDTFSGRQVEAWTDMKGPPVGLIMAEVRCKLGGSEVIATVCGVSVGEAKDNAIDPIHLTLAVWEEKMGDMTSDDVREVVLQAKEVLQSEGKLNVSWKDVKKLRAARKT